MSTPSNPNYSVKEIKAGSTDSPCSQYGGVQIITPDITVSVCNAMTGGGGQPGPTPPTPGPTPGPTPPTPGPSPSSNNCSKDNKTGQCPAGQVCNANGLCTPSDGKTPPAPAPSSFSLNNNTPGVYPTANTAGCPQCRGAVNARFAGCPCQAGGRLVGCPCQAGGKDRFAGCPQCGGGNGRSMFSRY